MVAYDSTGSQLFETKVKEIRTVDKGTLSSCAIPSDGEIRVVIDLTGITNASKMSSLVVK